MTPKMCLSRTAKWCILEEMNKAPARKLIYYPHNSHTGYEQVWIQEPSSQEEPDTYFRLHPWKYSKAKLTLIRFQVEHRLDTHKDCIPDLVHKTLKKSLRVRTQTMKEVHRGPKRKSGLHYDDTFFSGSTLITKTIQAKTTTKSPCPPQPTECAPLQNRHVWKQDIALGHRLEKLAAQKRPFHKTSLLPQVKGQGFQFYRYKIDLKVGGKSLGELESAELQA